MNLNSTRARQHKTKSLKLRNNHQQLIKMSVPPQLREFSWTNSAESSKSCDEKNNNQNNFGIFPVPQPRSRVQR